jgi:hypothetical protein
VVRWTASAKWAEGPALDGRRATLLGLGLNEGLGLGLLFAIGGLYVRRNCYTCGLKLAQLFEYGQSLQVTVRP